MTVKRVAIPKRTRFEVFKRDKFTCQYCGAKAPEVVLQCDHVRPVADGGENGILNLVTSCEACNGGKGAVLLSDSSAIDVQRLQIEALEERRQQLEMMLQWRDELQGMTVDAVDAVSTRMLDRTGFMPNESGRSDIRKWLKKYSLAEVLAAADEAFDTYLQFEDEHATSDSWNLAFRKIPGVASVQKQASLRPYLRDLFYIQGIIRKRARAPRYNCVDYLEHIHLVGMSIEDITRRAKAMRSLNDFERPIDAWLVEMGSPF